MKKKILFIIIYCQFFIANCYCQPPIQWEISFGGTNDEYSHCMIQTNDGGLIVGGEAFSNNGDVSGNHGNWDGWLVKLSITGSIQWAKCYGGSSTDRINSIIQTNDGGYICAGYSNSNDGDISNNHGHGDAWVLKLNDTGAIQWSKCYGGSSSSSEAYSIIQANGGGYIFCGITSATNGDVIGNHGGHDGWVVRIDNQGNLIWQKCYGGSSWDNLYDLIATHDGNYILTGNSYSNNGDGCTSDTLNGDSWVIKIDTSGLVLWSKCYGGNGLDGSNSIIQTLDGGYAVGGSTSTTNNGDVMCGTHTWYVIWVIKLFENGALQWSNCYADTIANGGLLCPSNDSGFVIAGNSSYWGAWILKVDISGNIHWSGRYGSYNGSEDVSGIIHCNDGGYAVITSSSGNNHDVTGHHGALGTPDYWVVKLAPDTAAGINEIKIAESISVYPNPASTSITIHSQLEIMNYELRITDVFGRVVYRENIRANDTQLDVSRWSSGVYFYEVRGSGLQIPTSIRGKFIKE
ncbi:MAG: T9SS type A sorting domain-containing protein [Bacteroidota bacterium]